MRKGRRVLAYLLAFIMVFSTIGSTELTVYANETNSVYEVLEEDVLVQEDENNVDQTVGEEATVEEIAVEEIVAEETTVKEPMEEVEPYYGNVYEHTYGDRIEYGLEILYEDMEVFSDEELLNIINYHKGRDIRFQSIDIRYPYIEGNPQGVVAKDVWNGLCDLLEDQYCNLMFMLIEEPETRWFKSCRDWICYEPTQTSEDVVLNAEWSVSEPGKGLGLTFANTTFPAQDVELQMYFNTDCAVYETVRAAFTEGTQGVLFLNDSPVMDCNVSLKKEEGSRVQFMLNDMNDLNANTNYVLNTKSYTGTVSKDNTSGTYNLDIEMKKNITDYYSEAEILDMLEWNKNAYGVVFGDVTFNDDVETGTTARMISGNLINAARSLMVINEDEFNDGWISFRTNGNVFDVSLFRPEENAAAADSVANVSYDLYVENGEVKLSFDAPEYNARQLSLRMYFEKGSEMATALEDVFGTNVTLYDVFVGENYNSAYYESHDYGVMITFNDVNDLERNTPHDVFQGQKKETIDGAPGNIIDSYGHRTLQVTASDVGKENWGKGEIAEDLKKYKELIDGKEMDPFNQIVIIQKEQDNNIIYKEDYNFLVSLLKSNAYTDLYFDFNGAWNGGETKEIIWNFEVPKKASADVRLNATYTAEGSEAVKLQISSSSYPANYVSLRCHTSAKSDLGKLFYGVYGEVDPYEDFKSVAAVKELGKETNVYPSYCSYSLFGEPEYGGEIDFSTGNLNTIGLTTMYLLPVKKYDEIFSVGKTEGYQLKTSQEPDGAVTWKSNQTYYATVSADGVLIPIRETEKYMFWATYTSDGRAITEVYEAKIERNIISMKFRNASMNNPLVMEMPPKGQEEERFEYLDIVCYPTGAWLNPDELEWNVSGNAVEKTGGNDSAEIKAVEAGEAIVTVTLKNNPNIFAAAKIIVKPSVLDEIDVNNVHIYAIDGIDTKLADLQEQLPEGFVWSQPATSIVGNRTWADYPAIYTSKDGRSAEVYFSVERIVIDELSVRGQVANNVLESGGAIGKNEKLYVGFDIFSSNFGDQTLESFNRDVAQVFNLKFTPDANTQKLLTVSDDVESGNYIFDAKNVTNGKTTLTFYIQALDKAGNVKGIVKQTSFVVVVSDKNFMKWYAADVYRKTDAAEHLDISVPAAVGETGEIVVKQSKSDYVKISAKSMDTAICTVGSVTIKEEAENIVTYINYTVKNAGRAYIALTAADVAKSKMTVRFDVEDVMPRVSNSTLVIDKARKNNDVYVALQMAPQTSLGEPDKIIPYTISGKNDESFAISLVGQEDDETVLKVSLQDQSKKTGTYKLKISTPVLMNETGEAYGVPFETTITVKVTDTKPSASIKQTKNYNTLFKDNADPGTLEIVPNGDWTVANVELTNQAANKKCDYILNRYGDTSYYIALKEGGIASNNKATLIITTNEYAEKKIVKNITIKTENKKPKLSFDKKKETLYPYYDVTDFPQSVIRINNPTTTVSDGAMELQVKKGNEWILVNPATDSAYATSKNSYNIYYDNNVIKLTLLSDKKATDKFKFRIKDSLWNAGNYVELSYEIKVDTSRPTPVLGNSTITLNKNAKIYTSQIGITSLMLKGGADISADILSVSFDGMDLKAENVKNRYLNMGWNTDHISISLNDSDKDLKTGKYKYSVEVYSENCGYFYTNLTVNIVDKDPTKCLSLSKKGSIDVLNREDTSITYKVKLSNIQGQIVGCYLKGPDARQFYAEYSDGAIQVKAYPGVTYSTKQTYKIQPVVRVVNDLGWHYTIDAKEQSFKVKQGKPKVTIKPANGADNILYRDRSNELELAVSAVLGKKNVKIDTVKLVNYTDDLRISDWNYAPDGSLSSVTISQYGEKQILASGKNWNVKFNVYFVDETGTEKVTQVTCKLMVK